MTGGAPDAAIRFDDGAAYERFMARWSQAAGVPFLDWIALPQQGRWLDIGCGTGTFTRLLTDRCRPAAVSAVDPQTAQIDFARGRPFGPEIDFRVADAARLPFPDLSFDVVVSALTINFIPDRAQAMREMRRVARIGAVIAGYVWDFASHRAPNAPLIRALRWIGVDLPPIPGAESSGLGALRDMFDRAGLVEVETTAFDIAAEYSDFDEFWTTQTPIFSPTTRVIATLTEPQRATLIDRVRGEVPIGPDGRIAYAARANAVKARVPP